MSWPHKSLIALTTFLGLIGASPVGAQNGDPDRARVKLGALTLSPSLGLTNSWDSNVLNETNNPTSDMTARVSPAVEAWFRIPRLRLSGRSQLDLFYFREQSGLRALNTDTSARLELVLNRLTPYVTGSLVNTRERQGLEIDAYARRRDDALGIGADVRLTGKASLGFYVGRAHVDYQVNTLYLGTDLATELNHVATVEGVAFRYAATPLTTVSLEVEQQQDRFALSSQRNSDSIRVTPSVEFKPFALIRGRAAIGFRKLRFLQGNVPEFKGQVASVDLQYTLRARTLLSVGVQRDLEYSANAAQLDYVQTRFTTSVTRRLWENWDIGGRLGRYGLSYRNGSQNLATLPSSTVLSAGVDVGYRMGRSRLAFNVDHNQRFSDDVGRGYQRLVIGSSLAYVF